MNDEHWAKPVDSLHIAHDLPPEALNLNVEGRRLAGLIGGFGRMWRKTYWVRLAGTDATPQEVIKVWKENFREFWPKGADFFGSTEGISPGDVALLNVKKPAVPLVSTGVLVLYSDDSSFSFVSPEGHMFVGMITFSAMQEAGDTVAQIELFIRAGDPLYELMMFFGGHRLEDNQWKGTLRSLASRFGVDATPEMTRVLVDRRRQWRHAKNIRHNAVVRSLAFALARPFRTYERG